MFLWRRQQVIKWHLCSLHLSALYFLRIFSIGFHTFCISYFAHYVTGLPSFIALPALCQFRGRTTNRIQNVFNLFYNCVHLSASHLSRSRTDIWQQATTARLRAISSRRIWERKTGQLSGQNGKYTERAASVVAFVVSDKSIWDLKRKGRQDTDRGRRKEREKQGREHGQDLLRGGKDVALWTLHLLFNQTL